MADEIIRLSGNFNADAGEIRILCVYDLSTVGPPVPFTYDTAAGADTGQVIPTPASTAPAEVAEQLNAEQTTGCNSGTHAWELLAPGINELAPSTETLDIIFAKAKQRFIDNLRERYARRGQRRTPGT